MGINLEFERPLAPLREQLEGLDKEVAAGATDELRLRRDAVAAELERQSRELYAELNRWQKVQVARYQRRPQTLDYAKAIFTEFVELRGDRAYADDKAIVGGPARLDGQVVMLIGHQRGHDTKEAVERNHGQPHPEGFRKALRLYRLAEKFGMPLLTFLDSSGASPGLEDEERGQAWALAENIAAMTELRVPIIASVIGEGGSGGSLALGVADRLLMLEHSVFSVATPEAAASIVWKDSKHAPEAAEALKLTAHDLLELGVADRIVPEPAGGAHSDQAATAEALREALLHELQALRSVPLERLLADRYEKYRRIGTFYE
ncbi:MAG TPA: acetyl-CoA carboxylase carboxyltransferase subunit alpha [Chloroflexota bacterium]|jgi:acetyl-CoA carboxylase carboxyl transferase subunit alpha|nr:acetyl-CoA carboxylase carboxyltransferase subunit alpha [Chloroflexota bacterium]